MRCTDQPTHYRRRQRGGLSAGIAYGGIATILGTHLSDFVYTAPPPYPQELGQTQVMGCDSLYFSDVPCVPMDLIYVGPSQNNFHIPDSIVFKYTAGAVLPSQNVVFSVIVNGVPDDAYVGRRSLDPKLTGAAPGIFFEGYDCFIDTRFQDANKNCGLAPTRPSTNAAYRGAVTDQQGVVLSSANPARIGQYYTIWMTGLGPFTNGKPKFPICGFDCVFGLLSMDIANVPGYADDTAFDGCAIGLSFQVVPCPDFPVELAFVGPSPQYPGLYQVNFQLPAQIAGVGNTSGNPSLFPCGTYNWEVSLEIEQRNSNNFAVPANVIQIPILVKPGDVPCASN